MSENKVLVIPCSGIGKAHGTVTRQATYYVLEKLRPEKTQTTCLALIVVDDEEALKLVKKYPCVTVDGCPYECSKKNLEAVGGNIAGSVMSTKVFRDNRDLKPESVTELGPKGEALAEKVAEKIVEEVDRILDGKS